MRLARLGFGAVVVAAGVSGVALLVAPASTGSFFSWKLGPPQLAALIGGLYVASSVVFGLALFLPWPQVRSLVAASFVLTAPTFGATIMHLEVFDLDRWQAWFWILLFGGAPWFWAGLLIAHRNAAAERRRSLRGLTVLTLALAAAAVVVWIDPVGASAPLPFDFSPMGGRFAGSWLAFLALLAGWAAVRPGESRLPLVALTVYPAGALVAALRSLADLHPPGARYAYIGGLVVAAAAFGAAASSAARPASRDGEHRRRTQWRR